MRCAHSRMDLPSVPMGMGSGTPGSHQSRWHGWIGDESSQESLSSE